MDSINSNTTIGKSKGFDKYISQTSSYDYLFEYAECITDLLSVCIDYLPKICEVSNTTIIAKPSDKSMILVKYFYLLHFCHSLLPFYIGAPTGRKKAAAQYFVQRPFPQ